MNSDDEAALFLAELQPVRAVIGIFKGRGPARGGLRARGNLRLPHWDKETLFFIVQVVKLRQP